MPSTYVRGNVSVTGLRELTSRLEVISKRLLTSDVVIQRIALLFEEMERQVFAGSGVAPEFGYSEPWAPLAQSTLDRRSRYGGELVGSDSALIAFGYLRAAAVNPRFESADMARELTLSIDPRKAGAPAKYSHGNNYGIFHETGTGVEQRMFAYITPEFRVMATKIARAYFLNPDGEAVGVPAYGSEKAPMPLKAKDHITGRKASLKGDTSLAYAKYEHRRLTGGNLSANSTRAKDLQNQYYNVSSVRQTLDAMSPRAAGGVAGEKAILSQFESVSAFKKASSSVARFNVSNKDGNAH